MDPIERDEAIREAEAHLAALADTEDAAFVVEGAGLLWTSIATGSGGTPTRFSPTAFGGNVLRVPLLNQHKGDDPLGVAEVVPGEDGLRVRAKLSNTSAARDALALVKDGALSGFSVGFGVLKSHKEDGVRVVTEATLDEMSLVTFPADRAARIMTAGGQPTPKYLHAASPKERERRTPIRADVLADIAEAEAFLRSTGATVPDSPTSPETLAPLVRANPEREMAARQMALYEANGLSPLGAAKRKAATTGAW